MNDQKKEIAQPVAEPVAEPVAVNEGFGFDFSFIGYSI